MFINFVSDKTMIVEQFQKENQKVYSGLVFFILSIAKCFTEI